MSGHKTISTSDKRIDGIQLQSSSYGGPVPLVYGTNRVPANLLWYGDFVAIPHTSSQSAGGKGGSTTQKNTTYTYQAAVALAACEGPINSIPRAWQDKTEINAPGWAIFTGADGQSAWSYLTSKHPDKAINYNRMAYVGIAPITLDDQGGMPNHNLEVMGNKIYAPGSINDANPKDVISDFMTDPYHGVPQWDAARLGDLTQFSNYCIANNLFLSPALVDQRSAGDILQELVDSTNTLIVWSEGKLKFVPRSDQAAAAHGVTYTPNNTPIYDLGDDDFLDTGNDPVRLMRKRPSDAYNRYPVEYANRANAYALDVVEAKDQGDIALHGLRKADKKELHMICDGNTAMAIAQILLQRSLYIRNTYEFDLDFRYSLLEPGDLVTLTDSKLGLNKAAVQILSVEETSDGYTVTAEEYPYGVNSHALYPTQTGAGYAADLNVAPGNVNPPVIFEAPDTLTTSGLEIWLGVSGQGDWGGCDVWASYDDQAYQRIGTLHGGARQGTLRAALPAGSDPDTADTLAVDLTMSGGSLTSGSQAGADGFTTLCYVDGELLSYETATLNATGQYSLTYLRRGAYGTPNGAHAAGAAFLRLDQAIVKYPFDESQIGKTLYLKFLSFNQYGGGEQTLDSVTPYQYKILGSATTSPLPDVKNLTTVYQDNQMQLVWDPVVDFRAVTYQIRKGSQFNTAEIVGTITGTQFVAMGDGQYWVVAKYNAAISQNPASIDIAGATLTANVVATYDEAAAKWPGTMSGGCHVDDLINLVLVGAANFSTISDVSKAGSIRYFGGVQPSGYYEIPTAHQIDIGNAQACRLSVVYSMVSTSPYKNFSDLPDVGAEQTIIGAYAGYSDVRVQVAIADNSGTFGAWQDFNPGVYVGRIFKFRLSLDSTDTTVTAMVSGFKFTVDVPDRVESGANVAIPAGGTTIRYSRPFLGGPNGSAAPGPSITLLNAQAGDQVNLSNPTLSSFDVSITNNGTAVARSINWITQAY